MRWLRVNTLKWSVEDAVEWFENERWELYEDVEAMIDMSHVSRATSLVSLRRTLADPPLLIQTNQSQSLRPRRTH